MKRFYTYVIFAYIFGAAALLPAEDTPATTVETPWDIDSLFDTPSEDTDTAPVPDAKLPSTGVLSSVQRTGVTLDAGYSFSAGYSPGWEEAPWFWDDYGDQKNDAANLIMTSSMGLDFQISEVFRVYTGFAFSYPAFAFTIRDFYFDYAIYERVFLRAGKYSASAWGLSPNYPFTNLLARTPSDIDRGEHYIGSPGNLYTAKVDVPVGIGGFQAVSLVHDDFFNLDNHQSELIGFGGKYNIALRYVDIDTGFFYQKIMPFRAFVSVKTTIRNTELYGEFLVAFPHGAKDNAGISANIGVVQSFFSDKLRVNGEVFYNGETGAFWYKEAVPERDLDAVNSPFISGVNTALNLEYKPGGWGGFRFFVQCLYSFAENSAQLAPGLRFSPLKHVNVSAAVPMALGDRNGTYYRSNADSLNRPFAFVLAVTISGNYKHGWYN